MLVRGRTANVSEKGLYLVGPGPRRPMSHKRVVLEMDVPAATSPRGRRETPRIIRYLCRIVHTQSMGSLLGVGLEFLEKVQT